MKTLLQGIGISVIIAVLALQATGAAYTEKYRLQYHFSPSAGSMGDPCGTVRYNNTYHLFWWGHAVSSDLVYWAQMVYPMLGGDGSFGYWSGSAVVDLDNTSGLGYPAKPAMVALYTMHNNTTQKETVGISSSTNQALFYYWGGNPVLSTESTVFRDPDVFWHEPTGRWIMVISKAADKKLRFYSSADLKTWEFKSEFGPMGARDQMWEVPGLMQLPVNGNSQNKKWVLFCGKGPNKVQYFTGDFDGTNFTLEATSQAYLSQGSGLPGVTAWSFNATSYSGWNSTGSAFGSGPAQGSLPGQQQVTGYLGQRLVNSYLNGDGATGTLTSPAFEITNNCINFLIGGGNNPGQTCLDLLVNGQVVQSATGANDECLRWAGWNVSQWKGQTAQLRIVDTRTASWGHVLVDHIQFSDTLMSTGLEHANWVEWGSDFYAPRVYRDYDGAEQCITWLGWMGNWQYNGKLPTSWGQGAQSIPRNLQLLPTARGHEIAQQPLPRLQKLRGSVVRIGPRKIENVTSLNPFQPQANTYEIEAEFNVHSTDQNFGLNLCVSGTNKVVLGYDAATSNVYLDRRASGNVSFDPAFPVIVNAPVAVSGEKIKFHVFVDQSSIEVFVNDGIVCLTSVIFPEPTSLGVEAFSSTGATTLVNFNAWNLSSIWR